MADITQKNFDQNYDKIINDFKMANFISIDCEFTGLFQDNISLFDTPKKRYEKARNNLLLKDCLIVQMGFTSFCYNRTQNNFTSSTYNFYLMPAPIFHTNKKFSCQIDSLEFLCRSNFNFNTLFYDGINYVNEKEENNFLQMLNKENFLSFQEEDIIQEYCFKIFEWETNSEEVEFFLDVSKEKDYFVYLLHLIIRKNFDNLWTFYDEPHKIKVKKIKESEKSKFLSNKDENIHLQQKLHKSILGFTRIMNEIKKLKKPIVGHNLYLDLLIIYNQFYGILPASYKKFKQKITEVFPQIYDTKHMSYHLRKHLLKKNNKWYSNSLKDLFDYFFEGKGSSIVICTPPIMSQNKDYLKTKNFHNAGFDSFCTGFCFIKMAHIYSQYDKINKIFLIHSLPPTSASLLKAVEFFKNRINFPKSQINFIVLDGSDSEIKKSCFLLVKKKQNQILDVLKFGSEIAKYPSAEICIRNQNTAILAVRNIKHANEILEHFKNSEEFHVTPYSFVEYLLLERKKIVCSVVVATLAFLFYKWLRK